MDWYTGESAIFANVKNLKAGDEIDISRADGKLRTYHVVSAELYDFETTDATPIIAPTDVPTVTLITCEGTFNPATHEYDKRLVVRATAGRSRLTQRPTRMPVDAREDQGVVGVRASALGFRW